jgi:hypothetical protein
VPPLAPPAARAAALPRSAAGASTTRPPGAGGAAPAPQVRQFGVDSSFGAQRRPIWPALVLAESPHMCATIFEEAAMQHVHAGRCEECEQGYYVIGFRAEEPKSMGTFVLYHLEERCAVLPSYSDLLEAD